MRSPILITGAPRTGTSATAGIFWHCGAFGGWMRYKSPYNPKGMFENKDLVNINKAWLVRNGYDYLGQKPVPGRVPSGDDWPSVHEVELLRTEVWNSLTTQGWDGEQIWFFKDPKITWNWPLWMSTFPDASWIIVERDLIETAKSCIKTGFMKAYHSIENWRKWAELHYERLSWISAHTLNVWYVEPKEYIVKSKFNEIKTVIEQNNLKWNSEAEKFIEKRKTWHGSD